MIVRELLAANESRLRIAYCIDMLRSESGQEIKVIFQNDKETIIDSNDFNLILNLADQANNKL